jgi:hypothetical protein
MGARVHTGGAWTYEGWLDLNGEFQTDKPGEGTWYLLPNDVREGEEIGEAMARRREYELPVDLTPAAHNASMTERTITLKSSERAEREARSEEFGQYDVPRIVQGWTERDGRMVQKMVAILEAVERSDESLTSHGDLARTSGVSKGTLGKYFTDELLNPCINKVEGEYCLTSVGRRAKDVPWSDLIED